MVKHFENTRRKKGAAAPSAPPRLCKLRNDSIEDGEVDNRLGKIVFADPSKEAKSVEDLSF